MFPKHEDIYDTPTMLRIAKRIHTLSNEELKTLNTYVSDVQECILTEITRRAHRASPRPFFDIKPIAPDERPTVKDLDESLRGSPSKEKP